MEDRVAHAATSQENTIISSPTSTTDGSVGSIFHHGKKPKKIKINFSFYV